VVSESENINKSRLRFNLTLTIVSEVLNKIIPFIIIYVGQRALGVEGFGVANFSIYMVDAALPFIAFGYSTLGILKIGKLTDPQQIGKMIGQVSFVRLVHALMVIVALNVIMSVYPGYAEYRVLVNVLGFTLFTAALESVYVLSGTQRLDVYIIFSIIFKVISLICILTFVETPDDLLLYVLFSYGFNGLIGLATFLYAKSKYHISLPNRADAIHLFKKALPFGVCSILLMVSDRLELFVIEIMTDPLSLGYYTGVLRVQQSILPLIAAIGSIFFSEMVSSDSRKSLTTHARLTVTAIYFVLFPVAVGIWFTSDQIIELLLGQSYHGVSTVLSMLVSGMLFHTLIITFGYQVLLIKGRIKLINIVLLAIIPLQLLLSIFLVKNYSLLGGATSVIIAKVFIGGVLSWLSFKYIDRFKLNDLVSILVAGVVMFLALSVLPRFELVLEVLVGGVCYLSVIALLNRELVVKLLERFTRVFSQR